MALIAQPQSRSLPTEHGCLFEYLLVATPSEEVYKEVLAEKHCFFDRYGEKISIKNQSAHYNRQFFSEGSHVKSHYPMDES